MRRALTLLLALPPVLALTGCGEDAVGQVRSAGPPVTMPQPRRTQPRLPVKRPLAPPPVQALPGVAGVIGASGPDLIRLFGSPRLDVLEGDARKLQFVGPACVLDIYLYPPAPAREPQASYVDARRASDGQDVDRAACIAAMRRIPQPAATAAQSPPPPPQPPKRRVTRP